MKEYKEYKKPFWMWIIIIVLGADIIYSIGFVIGIIVLIIMFACANDCVNWATRINKSKNWAFLIGYFFGLSGLLGYWIYYKMKGGKKNVNRTTKKNL